MLSLQASRHTLISFFIILFFSYIFAKNINTMITLNETQVKELEAFIQEMPTRFGLPLLKFLNKIAQEHNPESTEVIKEN